MSFSPYNFTETPTRPFFFTAENNAYCYRSGNAAFVHPPSFLSARPLCFVLPLSVAVHKLLTISFLIHGPFGTITWFSIFNDAAVEI